MVIVIITSLFVAFVNWLILFKVITNWKSNLILQDKEYLLLFSLVIFNIASFIFFRFLGKKIRNTSRIFLATILAFSSILSLHDIINSWGKENLNAEFSILAVAAIYYFYLAYLCSKKKKKRS